MSDVLIEIADENSESVECIVCYELISNNKEIWICPQCNIKIHKTCIKNLQKKECPHCRYKLTEEENNSLREVSPYRSLNNIGTRRQMRRLEYYTSIRPLMLCIAIFLCAFSVAGCLMLLMPIILDNRLRYLNLTNSN